MRNLLFLLLTLFSALSFGNTLNTLEFTQAYISCVKSFEGESANLETLGVVDSGLMNGQVLNGDIDGNYWEFMSCINPITSGATATSIVTASGCAPEVRNMNSPDIQVYLPFKSTGKQVAINGHLFICRASGWDFVSSTGQERRASCVGQNTDINSCRYRTPLLQHNEGGVFFNSNVGQDGSIVAYCDNGGLVVGASSCDVSACVTGERVRWHSQDVNGVYLCEGNVASNGAVIASEDDFQYYSTADSARAFSIVPSGSAKYICEDGTWKREPGVGSCEYKAPTEKICSEINVGKTKDYFCQ